ncbi:MAG: hypothetical protein HDT43_00765 [Ruminococcaceae bacterium]|nr:hypothetical protein [Oscillospiraceae bacterium]
MESKIALKSKIKELERIIDQKSLQISQLENDLVNNKENCRLKDNEIALLRKTLKGDRVCTGYCRSCKHAIDNGGTWYMGSYYPNNPACDLDCKCNDFKRK